MNLVPRKFVNFVLAPIKIPLTFSPTFPSSNEKPKKSAIKCNEGVKALT